MIESKKNQIISLINVMWKFDYTRNEPLNIQGSTFEN